MNPNLDITSRQDWDRQATIASQTQQKSQQCINTTTHPLPHSNTIWEVNIMKQEPPALTLHEYVGGYKK